MDTKISWLELRNQVKGRRVLEILFSKLIFFAELFISCKSDTAFGIVKQAD
jgi:hypothetical protein